MSGIKSLAFAARTTGVIATFSWMVAAATLFLAFNYERVAAQTASQLTPLQLEIEKQRGRLGSSETEERRDAVMRLGWMKRPESSRAAAPALHDQAAMVRAAAARAVLALPPEEAAAL